MYIRNGLGTNFHYKQTILSFGAKFAQSGSLEPKKRNRVIAWSLLSILNFSARGTTDKTAS